MKRLNTKGFTALEIILVIIIVGTLGGIVGYVVNANSSNKIDNKNLQTNPSKAPAKKGTDTNTATPVQPAKTKNGVLINEWGIKIIFEDSDKVTYKKPTHETGTEQYVLHLKDSVASVCQDLGIGFTKSANKPSGDNVTKVGDSYYKLGGAPGACDDDPGGFNGSINQLRQKIIGQQLGSPTGYKVEAL